MKNREQIIRNFLDAFVSKDGQVLKEIFDEKVDYHDYNGPIYQGIEQVEKFFVDFNNKGSITDYEISQFVHQFHITVIEWHCTYASEGNKYQYEGVILFEFNEEKRINKVREYETKAEHYYPYN